MTIGRSVECDLRLDDMCVSRRHCEIALGEAGWTLRDLGSGNGTQLNGQRIELSSLKDGDRIEVVSSVGLFVLEPLTIRIVATPEVDGGGDGISGHLQVAVDAEEQTLSTALAAQASPARVLDVAGTVSRASRSFQNAPTWSELFSKAVHEVVSAFPEGERCVIIRRDPETRRLSGQASHIPPGSDRDVTISRSVAVRVIDQKQALLWTTTPPSSPDRASRGDGPGAARSCVCAPIMRRGEPKGVIYLDSQCPDHALPETAPLVMSVIAHELGVAMDHMELLEQSAQKEKIEMALQVAWDIQASVLPHDPPAIPGFDIAGRCLPCDETSGDYYDFIPLPSGKWGIAVGDVTGHGIGPALVMMSARSSLRALTRSREGMECVMTDLNAILAEDVREDMFVSLLYLELDPDRASLSYLSAGHEPGILCRHRSGEVVDMEGTTHPLGLVPEMEPGAPVTLAIEPGDVLFLSTDGIAETRSPNKEVFGRERLLGVIQEQAESSADALVDAVLAEVEKFRSRVSQEDDLTIVAVKAE